jgi:uncharacterized protein with HEPN domain
LYLRDILDAASKARDFVAGMTREEFEADDKTVFAVVRALEIVGEASKNVSAEIQDRAPEVPWRAMAGMRDKLIHAYAGVNLAVVWRTVHEELPNATEHIDRVLTELDADEAS